MVNAKKYLSNVSKLDKMIANKMIEKEQWEAVAEGSTVCSEGERVQSSGNPQKMADAVCQIVMIEEEILKLIKEKQDIIRTIELLPATEYDILHKMYIGILVDNEKGKKITVYMTLEEVAEEYMMSYSWASTMHGRGIKKVQDILDERSC